jgi:hypothetical protein
MGIASISKKSKKKKSQRKFIAAFPKQVKGNRKKT